LIYRPKKENRDHPQAQTWQGADSLKTRSLASGAAGLPLVERFVEGSAFAHGDLDRSPFVPYFALHVEKILHPEAKGVTRVTARGALERGEQFLDARP